MSWNGTSIGKTDSVGITDIWNALGKPTKVVNGAVVNDYTINSLARHANINPYSLYKPMSVVRGADKTPYTLTNAANKAKGLTEDDMSIVNYGYAFPESGVGASVLKAWCINKTYPSAWLTPTGNQKAMGGGWIYCPPTGGEADPFRYGDFKGYNAKESTFVTWEAEYQVFTNEDNEFSIGGKSLKNFGGLKDKYYGLYIVDATSTASGHGLFWSSGKMVGNYDGKIDLTIPKASASTYFPTAGHEYYIFPVLFPTASGATSAHPLPVNPWKATAVTWNPSQDDPYKPLSVKTSVTSVSIGTSYVIDISWVINSGTLATQYPFYGMWSIEDANHEVFSGEIGNLTMNLTDNTARFILPRKDGQYTFVMPLEISVDIFAKVPVTGSTSGEWVPISTKIGATIALRADGSYDYI